MALTIERCPETGMCSMIKDDGSKADLMPDEVVELQDADGDTETIRAVLAGVDPAFAAVLDDAEIGQIRRMFAD